MQGINSSNFQSQVIEASYTKPVVVYFWAPFCTPCVEFAPVYEQVAAQTPDFTFQKLNVEENQGLAYEIAEQGGISQILMPSFYVFSHGQVIHHFQGSGQNNLLSNLDIARGTTFGPPSGGATSSSTGSYTHLRAHETS